jgi:hypothetical protein
MGTITQAVPAIVLKNPDKRLSNYDLYEKRFENIKEIPFGSKVRVRRAFKTLEKRSSSDLWSRTVYEVVGKDHLAYVLNNGQKRTAADLQILPSASSGLKAHRDIEPADSKPPVEPEKKKENRDEKEEEERKHRLIERRLAKLKRELEI